jgi:integration host factor subunit alpha
MGLTKKDIIVKIAEETDLPPNQSNDIVESFIEILKSTLESGEDILISGFGKFCINEKTARQGRNPATGENIVLPDRKVVTFKCSGKLKDRVNESKG